MKLHYLIFVPVITLGFVLSKSLNFPGPPTSAWAFHLPSAILPTTSLPEEEKTSAESKDPYGRETPRSTFENFVRAVESNNYEKAKEYLEPQWAKGKKPEELKNLVKQTRFLLDRYFMGSVDNINDESLGNLNDGLKGEEESVGKIRFKEDVLELILIRKTTEEEKQLWFISGITLQKIPALQEKADAVDFTKKLPPSLVVNQLWGAPLYIWLAGLVLIPLVLGFCWLLVHAFIFPVRLIKKFLGHPLKPYPFKTARPIIITLAAILHFGFVTSLGLPLLHRVYYGRIISIWLWFGIAWFGIYLIDRFGSFYQQRLEKKNRYHAHSLVVLGKKLFKAMLAIVVFLIMLNTLGFKINTVLAGLGIGGIALAFAAQKSIENFFGGISLLSDQAIRIGEFCKIGDRVGTVEDIGLRSTLIRTLDRTLLYVPNGSLAVENLENFTRRDKFWFHHYLGVRYETSSEQIRKILKGIRELFETHEKVENSSYRVRFVSMGAYSLDIELFAYQTTTSYEEHLECSEELLLQCIEIVESVGAEIAFPSQTTYLAQDSQSPVALESKNL